MICNCVDHLCTKIMVPVLLMSCSFFYCGHSRFKIHNLWKNRLDIVHVCKLWGILWNCISSASRIWFYLGVYVELRPVTRAYIMFTVTPMSLFMDRNWTINFFFLFYSIHYWTLEIQQMPFSVVIKLWIFYSLSSYFLKSKGERKGKKKKILPTENQIMIIILQCGQTICQTVWSLVQLLFWNEVLRLLDRYNE